MCEYPRLDHKEILLLSIVRNEDMRLPYFLKYYSAIGVDHMFIIDNGSTDGTTEILRDHPEVSVFHLVDNYRHHWRWMTELLDAYGQGHWCVVVDADEILSYPHVETRSLKDLRDVLEAEGSGALGCCLLDMYSNTRLDATIPKLGDNPLNICPWCDPDFDTTYCVFRNEKTGKRFMRRILTGNLRRRVFNTDVFLSKVPVFKYEKGVWLTRGSHAIDGVRMSQISGAVYHFKYYADFLTRVPLEARRGEYFNDASEYKDYARILDGNTGLQLHFYGSRLARSSLELIQLGLMVPAYETNRRVDVPPGMNHD